MSGYYGYSMSNNAVAAYQGGEKPLSRWTKSEIMEEISGKCNITEEKAAAIRKMTLAELKSTFLVCTSWHHTSKFYNKTDFYSLDAGRVEEITESAIAGIVSRRKASGKQDEGVKKAADTEKVQRDEMQSLFKYQKKYKTLSGFLRSKSVKIEDLRAAREKAISEKREQLRRMWEAQGYGAGLARIGEDAFVESYIR